METTQLISSSSATVRSHGISRPARRLAVTAAALAGPVVLLTAEAASAGVQLNHNESVPAPRRVRRSVRRLAVTAAAVAGPVVLLTAEAASARIAVNHNESVGRDG